jgi:two-component system KDP operon response regulator KdpE
MTTSEGPRVLVVDDEPEILRALAMNLSARGYDVSTAATGTAALTAAASGRHDVVVLDLGLPDIDGLDVIRGIRAHSKIPIVVLSARTGGAEKVSALDLGADDYVTKPFDVHELLARLRAATRRATGEHRPATIQLGPSTIDLVAKVAHRPGPDGEPVRVALTPTEWLLLELLLRNPGRLLTGPQLLTELRGQPDHTDRSYLRIFISQLRRKLEEDPARPRHLITEPGIGYRFQP